MITADWFRVSAVSPELTLITEPHVDELVSANMWLVHGRERDLLVDCGLGVASLRTALDPLVSGRDPVLVVTHAHLDHMGSAHEFAECWAHPAEPVGDPPPGSLFGPALAAELGLDEALPPLLISALPYPGYEPARYRLRPGVVTRSLSEGDVVDPGGRPLTVLRLRPLPVRVVRPGHGPSFGRRRLHAIIDRYLKERP